MNKSLLLFCCALPILSGGCATASFAPPRVEVDRYISAQDPSTCGTFAGKGDPPITHDVIGATRLINNFLRSYRCAAHEAADGRQIFEIPSMAALFMAGLGPTFGLGNDGRIAALGSSAILTSANSYYAPKEKAAMIDSAIDGVLCIKTAAVDVDFYDTRAAAPQPPSAADQNLLMQFDNQIAQLESRSNDVSNTIAFIENRTGGGAKGLSAEETSNYAVAKAKGQAELASLADAIGALTLRRAEILVSSTAASTNNAILIERTTSASVLQINVSQQYFEAVSAALFSVERVLAQRLSDAGTVADAAGIAAEIEKLTKEKEDAEEALADAARTGVGAPLVAGGQFFASATAKEDAVILLDMKKLQPALQKCVVRAKI